ALVGHLVHHEFKRRMRAKLRDVGHAARRKIIQGRHALAELEQALRQVRSDKSGPAGDEKLWHVLRSRARMTAGSPLSVRSLRLISPLAVFGSLRATRGSGDVILISRQGGKNAKTGGASWELILARVLRPLRRGGEFPFASRLDESEVP